MDGIRLIQGVTVKDLNGVKKEYKIKDSNVILTLSAEDYKSFFTSAVKAMKGPVFFFIEIPDGEDGYKTYYLDNCTVSVAQAILKRYGEILYADGVIRFGFGSHADEDEIYMQEFQRLCIYSKDAKKYEKIISGLGYLENDGALSIWDILSGDNTGLREAVECDDESYVDIVNNLIDIGMYAAE